MEMFAAGAISLAATTGLARTVLATADRDGLVTVWHTEKDVTITINHDAWAIGDTIQIVKTGDTKVVISGTIVDSIRS